MEATVGVDVLPTPKEEVCYVLDFLAGSADWVYGHSAPHAIDRLAERPGLSPEFFPANLRSGASLNPAENPARRSLAPGFVHLRARSPFEGRQPGVTTTLPFCLPLVPRLDGRCPRAGMGCIRSPLLLLPCMGLGPHGSVSIRPHRSLGVSLEFFTFLCFCHPLSRHPDLRLFCPAIEDQMAGVYQPGLVASRTAVGFLAHQGGHLGFVPELFCFLRAAGIRKTPEPGGDGHPKAQV